MWFWRCVTLLNHFSYAIKLVFLLIDLVFWYFFSQVSYLLCVLVDEILSNSRFNRQLQENVTKKLKSLHKILCRFLSCGLAHVLLSTKEASKLIFTKGLNCLVGLNNLPEHWWMYEVHLQQYTNISNKFGDVCIQQYVSPLAKSIWMIYIKFEYMGGWVKK